MSSLTLARPMTHAGVAVLAALALTTASPVAATTATPVQHACPALPHQMSCLALIRTDVVSRRGIVPQSAPAGLGATALRKAYALPGGTAGTGRTVAVIDAYDDPNAESDLATYRSQYGLPPCTRANGCFTKVDQNGGTDLPAPNNGWAEEVSLDLDMVSAACPNCRILLVEASDSSTAALGKAVNTAVTRGAKFVSNSWGGAEEAGDVSSDSAYFDHRGVAITVASGDSGYGLSYPASSSHVTAVGGTTLSQATNARGWTETVWSGAGSGCSGHLAKPEWQKDTGCAKRSVADVAAVADPATGVSVYDTYQQGGWLVVGGTSASAPLIASVYALAGPPPADTYAASLPYAHPGALNDVVSGSNGACDQAYLCTAGAGYDGPTGLGSPAGIAAFQSGDSKAAR
jgi:subtilase family serine protease